MFDWIANNRDLFLVNYTEIGNSHQMAVELNSEHTQFANSAVVSVALLGGSLVKSWSLETELFCALWPDQSCILVMIFDR